jgi:segregation and condensation protein A
MDEDIYKVKVENIFEGPMDLLIHLIRKNEVDIYDIPIALITDQYLEYLEWMKAMNIDLAGDFLLMAATLAHIKSRMLLPGHGDEEDEEDPRMEIARPLLEYLKMKQAADELAQRQLLGEYTFARKPGKLEIPSDAEEAYVRVGLYELVEAFKSILENVAHEHRVNFNEDLITLKDRIAELVEILEDRGSVTFQELFPEKPDRSLLVITFLATLEMVKLNLVRVVQSTQNGIIRLFYV